jgi:putative nucleotidyltransferase with HDIG domain
MLDRIENALRSLIIALQMAMLYGTKHPRLNKFLDNAYESLQEVLKDREELVIGIVAEELAFEKEILFELSRTHRPIIMFLKARGIERIAFHRPMDKEELVKFISFLMTPKDEIKKDVQEYLNLAGIKNINAGKIKVSAANLSRQEGVLEALDFINLYNNSMDNIQQSLESVLNAQDMDYLNLRFGITNVLENLVSRYQELLKLTVVKRYDINTFVHIMNVSILSMYFSSKLGLNKDDILDIGIAALFHDIGKIYISRYILRKAKGLTEVEFSKIQSHTLSGAEILLKYVDTLGILPVVVCFEHHLRAGFKSYPKLSYSQRPHIASCIVAICDVYDALFQRRTYKANYPPNVVYEIVTKERENFFEPQLVDNLFKIIGVWPIGTIVILNDKRIAVVRDENEDDIFSPKVEVVFPQDKKEFIDLREKKDQIKIEKYLDPLGEGKDYVSLI